MSTLRFDVTTGDWVAFSSVRSLRPDTLHQAALHQDAELPSHDPSCPFCVGNEARTPTVTDVEPDPESPERWAVRVFPNKFPVLEPQGSTERRVLAPLFREMDGYGRHEVVIESPDHARLLADQSRDHVASLLGVLHRRSRALLKEPALEIVQIFKNHGSSAGSSMPHPHFQLLATPIVPRQIRIKYQTAAEYYQLNGTSVYSELCRAELAARARIVAQNPDFVAFAPFASRSPYETWIVPLSPTPTFESAEASALGALASILLDVLGRLRRALGNPPYNLIVNSAPRRHADEPDFVWHLELVPRLSTAAGFELGTGMAINSVLPEYAAEVLRAARPER